MKLYQILWNKWNDFLNGPGPYRIESTTATTTAAYRIEAPKRRRHPSEKSPEDKIYNPIGAKIGGSISIDALDFRDLHFFVQEIIEGQVVNGKSKYVDYALLARPLEGDDVNLRLRLIVPTKTTDAPVAIIMKLDNECEYDKGLHDVVQDDSKKFVIDDTLGDDDESNDIHEEFWRIGDVGNSYTAKLTLLRDENVDGKVARDEVSAAEVEFWDYSRETEIDGVTAEEYLFVELNKESGMFQIWRGFDVSTDRVSVY